MKEEKCFKRENASMSLGSHSSDFKVLVSEYKNFQIVSFENTSEIDLYNIREVAAIFKEGNNRGVKDWAIDLSVIQFIDSSGLSGLIDQSLYLTKYNKQLILLNPSNKLKLILDAISEAKVFSILSDTLKL